MQLCFTDILTYHQNKKGNFERPCHEFCHLFRSWRYYTSRHACGLLNPYLKVNEYLLFFINAVEVLGTLGCYQCLVIIPMLHWPGLFGVVCMFSSSLCGFRPCGLAFRLIGYLEFWIWFSPISRQYHGHTCSVVLVVTGRASGRYGVHTRPFI